MSDETEMKCRTCRFFGERLDRTNGHSTCHANAPGNGQRGFPIVDHHDWCGQWSSKELHAAAPITAVATALDAVVELKLENNTLRGCIDGWIAQYNEMKEENTKLAVTSSRYVELLDRGLFARIFNIRQEKKKTWRRGQ